MIEDWLEELGKKNDEGILTVGEAAWGYYRLLDGPDAGRVIIKSYRKVDNEEAIEFANTLTWAYLENYKNTRCEATRPNFPPPIHQPNYVIWYNDNSDKPMHYEW